MAKKILVVDDEAELVKALQIRLEAKGYVVVSAFDGEEGVKKAEEEKPDLITLDVTMPKMDGFTALKELKKRLKGSLPPVIVLTAREKMQDLFAMEGVSDYLTKPFDHQKLLEKIDKLLKE